MQGRNLKQSDEINTLPEMAREFIELLWADKTQDHAKLLAATSNDYLKYLAHLSGHNIQWNSVQIKKLTDEIKLMLVNFSEDVSAMKILNAIQEDVLQDGKIMQKSFEESDLEYVNVQIAELHTELKELAHNHKYASSSSVSSPQRLFSGRSDIDNLRLQSPEAAKKDYLVFTQANDARQLAQMHLGRATQARAEGDINLAIEELVEARNLYATIPVNLDRDVLENEIYNINFQLAESYNLISDSLFEKKDYLLAIRMIKSAIETFPEGKDKYQDKTIKAKYADALAYAYAMQGEVSLNNKKYGTALEEFAEAYKYAVEAHKQDSRYDHKENVNYRIIFCNHAQLFDADQKLDEESRLKLLNNAVDLFFKYADVYCGRLDYINLLTDLFNQIQIIISNKMQDKKVTPDEMIHLFEQFELSKDIFTSYPKDNTLTHLLTQHQRSLITLLNQYADSVWKNNDWKFAEKFYRMSLKAITKISHDLGEVEFEEDKCVLITNIQACLDEQALLLVKQKKWLDMAKLYVEVVKLYSEIKESLLTPEMIESKRGYEQGILAYFKFYIDDLKSVDNKEKLFSEAFALIKDLNLPDIKQELQAHFDYINNESKRPSM
ncbi:MAG: hypothetical protein P4M12_06765 [Gammaproteobacteria bacterium]|nr:hypothetical protein [Gammaproteobacteria bacterium]